MSGLFGGDLPTNEELKQPFIIPPWVTSLHENPPSRFPQYATLKGLTKNLPNIKDSDQLQEWLNSEELFAGHWKELYQQCFGPVEKRANKTDGGHPGSLTLADVNRVIRYSQSYGKYSMGEHSDKRGWNELDHKAFFLYDMTNTNMLHESGVFYGSDWSMEKCRNRIWQAMRYIVNSADKHESTNKKSDKVEDEKLGQSDPA